MKISDAIPHFKKYALWERGITPKSLKGMIKAILLLNESTSMNHLKSCDTRSIREFLYEQKNSKMWSNKTFRNYRQYLKSFFQYCLREGWIESNPIIKIDIPKISKSLPRCLSKNEVEKLLLVNDTFLWRNHVQGARNKAIIRTFLFTGVRLSELLNLKSIHVNLEEREILIVEGKGRKDRVVPIHAELYPYLKAYKFSKKYQTRYFFSSIRSDHALTQKNLYAITDQLKKECGFHFSPHMLRHTMGKMSIEANLNPFILQSILGHADISTTQIYVAVSSRSVKENFEHLKLI